MDIACHFMEVPFYSYFYKSFYYYVKFLSNFKFLQFLRIFHELYFVLSINYIN